MDIHGIALSFSPVRMMLAVAGFILEVKGCLSINIINPINELKDKNYMIVSIDTDKTLTKSNMTS